MINLLIMMEEMSKVALKIAFLLISKSKNVLPAKKITSVTRNTHKNALPPKKIMQVTRNTPKNATNRSLHMNAQCTNTAASQ